MTVASNKAYYFVCIVKWPTVVVKWSMAEYFSSGAIVRGRYLVMYT